MKKFIAIMLSLVMLIVFAACTSKSEEPANESEESAILSEETVKSFLENLGGDPMASNGIGFVVNTMDGTVNEDLWDSFKEEAKAGTPTQVMLAGYNMQGEAIYSCLTFDGEKFILYTDNSRDSALEDENTWRVSTAKHLYDIQWDEEEEDGKFHYRSAFISDGEYAENDAEARFDFDHDKIAVWGRRDPIAD